MSAATAAMRSMVLVVDDQPANLISIRAILQNGRYDVATAQSGEQALAAVLTEDFACIILDVAMPGMDGFETARSIKERDRSRTIPILFVTASVLDIDHVYQGYTVGAVDYLQKPVQSEALRAKVKVFVDLHEQSREISRQARELQEAQRRESALLEKRARDEEGRRQLAVAALTVSEARFKALEDSGLIGVVNFDLDGEITSANEAFWRFLGFKSARPPSYLSLVPPEKLEAERAELVELGISGVLPVAEKELLRASGERVWVLIGRAAIREGQVTEGVGFVVDVTGRKQVENERTRILGELRKAVRARDDFLSIAAHELRTPLTPLRLQLDGLRRTLPLDEASEVAMQRLDRSARRLEKLVSELLDVARLAAGKPRIEPESLDLSELVAEVVQRFRQATRDGAEIDLSLPGPLMGKWDRMRIEQVLDNLLSNAVKYGMGKTIEVELSGSDGEVRVAVRDHGPGIPVEAQEKIFERFERLGSHRQYGGFGLGLWIARQAAEAHGGRLEVHSEPGDGAEFDLLLPRTTASPSEPAFE